jgi:hypothetical protein
VRNDTQRERIRAHLEKGLPITPLEALSRFGCFRLGARIHELKRDGLPIECTLISDTSGTRFAQYRLAY